MTREEVSEKLGVHYLCRAQRASGSLACTGQPVYHPFRLALSLSTFGDVFYFCFCAPRQAVFLLLISFAYGNHAEVACRAVAGTHTRQVKEQMKAAGEEVKNLRLNQLLTYPRESAEGEGPAHTLQADDAWSIHHDSVNAANSERTKEGC